MVFRRLLALALPSTREVVAANDRTPEAMAHANRVVVYGSRLSGAFGLAVRLQEFLAENGIENPEVCGERFTGQIENAFYGRNEQGEGDPTIPRGVIALHEMRQQTPSGTRMFVPTPHGSIQELCDRHEVPFVAIAEAPTPEAIGSAVTGLLVPQNPTA
jgi:hypothetical protein